MASALRERPAQRTLSSPHPAPPHSRAGTQRLRTRTAVTLTPGNAEWTAPPGAIATAHFRTYVPLKELGRFRAAETMLLYCQEVYEAAENTAGQARTACAAPAPQQAWALPPGSPAKRWSNVRSTGRCPTYTDRGPAPSRPPGHCAPRSSTNWPATSSAWRRSCSTRPAPG
ncbi:hypothetical protein SBRY_40146 [Actinacidiphila bryophytorum]|uniref:Uncharacterized protein n=1 Tax=Actinacidiphila bryophytorum TaxID=1436133 RepID=A0A9W4MHX5_9ACTN|nr:hypothetical protein SBRY_40146 [Actinacidiphila bryophytorum]